MALHGGREQQAECQRSGKKCRASELVRDGRNPQLLVLPEWADPEHPQEHPYGPDDQEGVAQFPIAPDTLPDPVFSLTGSYVRATHTLTLNWTIAQLLGPRAENYAVYKSTDGGAYSVVGTFPVDYTNATGHVANIGIQKDYGRVYYVAQTTTDSAIAVSHVYTYYIAAVDALGEAVATTNSLTLTVAADGSYVLVPPANDPFFANVSLLLHLDGSLTDSSHYAHTVTLAGSAALSTTEHMFGSGSVRPTLGPNDFVSMLSTPIAGGGELDLSTGDFTIEFWVKRPTQAGGDIVMCTADDAFKGGFFMNITNTQVAVSFDDGTGSYLQGIAPMAVTPNAWNFIVLQRRGIIHDLYSNGIRSAPASFVAANPVGSKFRFGGWPGSGAEGLQGYGDEIRVTKGIARYTANFTPPDSPFPNS
jgi:Concanavalin A-like lectin/glucanases superfamily